MITGESVPQMNKAIDVVASTMTTSVSITSSSTSLLSEESNTLDFEDSSYKRAILFGVTLLVNHSSKPINEENNDNDKHTQKNTLSLSLSCDITSMHCNGPTNRIPPINYHLATMCSLQFHHNTKP